MALAALQKGTKDTRPLPPGSSSRRHALHMLPYFRRHVCLQLFDA